jgi:hypothetical protein
MSEGPGSSHAFAINVGSSVVTQLRVYRRHPSVASDRTLAVPKFSDCEAELQPGVYTWNPSIRHCDASPLASGYSRRSLKPAANPAPSTTPLPANQCELH